VAGVARVRPGTTEEREAFRKQALEAIHQYVAEEKV